MLIRSLTLKNVKSYALGTVEFSPGANAIIGSNGSGKSTVLEAVGYALFDHRPGKLSGFVREGEESATVTVDFLSDFDERTYRVVRRCGRGADYRVFDPELSSRICEGRADVIQFLSQHLGLDAESNPAVLFRSAVGVPQGSFTASFLETPSVRKASFDPLLKVAEYHGAWERLREPLGLLTQRQNDKAVEISGLEGELKRLPMAQTEAGEFSTQINSAETKLGAVLTELVTAEAARREMEARRERFLALQNLARMLRQAVAVQERTLSAARQRRTEGEAAVTITEANWAGHAAYRAAQQRQRAVNERLAQRQKLQDERNEVQTRLTQSETQKDAHSRALAEVAEAEKTAAALADEAHRQEELEADLRDARRQADRLKDTRARVERDQAAVGAAEERLERLRVGMAEAQKIETSLAPLQAREETLLGTVSAEQARVDQLHAQKKSIEEQGLQLKASRASAICPICEQPLSAKHRQQLVGRLRVQWKELNEEAVDAAETIRQAKAEWQRIRSTRARREQALRKLPRQGEIEIAEAELAERRVQRTEAGDAAKALEHAPQRVDRLQQLLGELGNPRHRRDVALHQAKKRVQTEEAIRHQQARAEQQRTALATLDEGMAAFANVEAEAARISSQLEEFRTADDLYRRHQTAAEELPLRKREVTEAETALQAAQERYESEKVRLAESEREFNERRYQEAVAQVDEIRDRKVRLETDLGQWRERLIRAEKEIAQLQSRQQRLVVARSLHDRLTGQKELLRSLRSVLLRASPFVTRKLVQRIGHAANQLFGEIMEDYTRTLRWQEDYEIVLEVDGRERPFSQLSGGEQMSAALAVRLALLREMSGIAIAFFDEPTINLDDARRVALGRQIVGVSGFQQLFVISHDDSFEQATETLIRVEKRDGVSEVFYE